ncbi:MAG: 3-isopropylmalate dehydratase small subunit [Chloroflexi bacterium]|nr:3-isopropylmalate dehydratase small subunit [Chloroflexota bacterium]MBI3734328.1 3-isopropylmalate dehydratase small subunit [Chloroflexota bacterium]
MQPIKTFAARLLPLPSENIDTDQIIPARYLKVTDKAGLGDALFTDWRARDPNFILNQPRAKEAGILVAGDNFGCGSSREHAPWALLGFGFKAVISTSFADIFRNNALKNGLLPIVVDEATHQQLMSLAEEDPSAQITVDLAAQTITLPDGRAVTFPMDGFVKQMLLQGVDEVGYLTAKADAIAQYEQAHGGTLRTQPSLS